MKFNLMKGVAIASAAAALLAAAPASANILVWTLDGATFDDGGTASGSFDFDTSNNTYFDINITTTAGSVLTGDTYTAFDPGATVRNSGFGTVPLVLADLSGSRLLDINAEAGSDFTTPGTVRIGNPGQFVSSEGNCVANNPICNGFNPLRGLSGDVVGTIAPAPEPTTWALMLFGVFGVGGMLRSRRQLSAAATA